LGAVVVDHSPLEIQETYMSKGMDRKKDTKKKPAKTLMEKRAAKKQKKESRPFSIARSALVSAYRLTPKYSWRQCSESLRRGPSRSLDWAGTSPVMPGAVDGNR
jgi:hypothetical protein